MAFLLLSKDERKVIIKYGSVDKLKKAKNKDKRFQLQVKKLLGKPFDKLKYEDIVKYINDHIENENEDYFINEYRDFVLILFVDDCRDLLEMEKEVHNVRDEYKDSDIDEYHNSELLNKVSEILYSYEDKYKNDHVPFDVFRRLYLYTPANVTDEYIADKKKEQEEAVLQEKLQKLSEYENRIKSLETDLQSSIDSIGELSEKLQKYQDILSVNSVKYKLTSILRVNVTNLTEEEIYEKLNDEEKKSLENEDYSKLKKVLAAKYYMIKLREVE